MGWRAGTKKKGGVSGSLSLFLSLFTNSGNEAERFFYIYTLPRLKKTERRSFHMLLVLGTYTKRSLDLGVLFVYRRR